MSLAIINSCALSGMAPHAIRVEVHVGVGLPAFTVVGLPDTGVRESRERVRSAILSSGFEFPSSRITVNLAPADLPKDAAHFDLPIALGVLLASGQMAVDEKNVKRALPPALEAYVFAGELSLTGAVVDLPSPLALALGVKALGANTLFMPSCVAKKAALVEGLSVYGVSSLSELVQTLCCPALPEPAGAALLSATMPEAGLCWSEVKGQLRAKHALEVAVMGGHNVLLVGSPGVGKSMLAQRFSSLMPPLSAQQFLEVAALSTVAGETERLSWQPPLRSPHHSCTVAALVGGGLRPKPGEISLAHHGVLFLDEIAEFSRSTLEALREPLESGEVRIARAGRSVTFPARFQLVAAMNPCPCGWHGHKTQLCRCTTERIERYTAKLSGPFLDRLDIRLTLASDGSSMFDDARGETSVAVQERVIQAQAIQLQRQACLNAHLGVAQLKRYAEMQGAASELLQASARKWSWSNRTVHRLWRVARTIADAGGSSKLHAEHVAQAIQYRG
ncbi:YifB family Mg chelatase-like AAA ATPase [Paenalcaligenes niemegkensis]|uniref:YifB family Mg chelatase-like AAA ATPase n=1 Tax=Paenalcaligenes niemegkensis TaxID=2895469 RepID=UPI001EE7F433|nr:YifB family Mg chelatase-like AAA ATPase [Paenalcaligenes niemegkensis]MCQ9616469.1 YifB family Mg chelatase-like AAA ATPase [Paenalcaligenes niemegkensis]